MNTGWFYIFHQKIVAKIDNNFLQNHTLPITLPCQKRHTLPITLPWGGESKGEWKKTCDAGTTFFWEVEFRKKISKYCTHCLRAKLRFWELRIAFLRKNWLTTNNINQIDWERCWKKNKTANAVPTVFEQKYAFESFGPHFWENNWLTSNINDLIDLKRCWIKNKNSKSCAHCLRAKVCFWELRASFLKK